MNWRIEHTAEGHTDEGIDTVSYVYAEVALEQGADIDDFKEEVRDYFREECNCAGDCCGHLFGGVDLIVPRWQGAEDWIVRASYRRNV